MEGVVELLGLCWDTLAEEREVLDDFGAASVRICFEAVYCAPRAQTELLLGYLCLAEASLWVRGDTGEELRKDDEVRGGLQAL